MMHGHTYIKNDKLYLAILKFCFIFNYVILMMINLVKLYVARVKLISILLIRAVTDGLDFSAQITRRVAKHGT